MSQHLGTLCDCLGLNRTTGGGRGLSFVYAALDAVYEWALINFPRSLSVLDGCMIVLETLQSSCLSHVGGLLLFYVVPLALRSAFALYRCYS